MQYRCEIHHKSRNEMFLEEVPIGSGRYRCKINEQCKSKQSKFREIGTQQNYNFEARTGPRKRKFEGPEDGINGDLWDTQKKRKHTDINLADFSIRRVALKLSTLGNRKKSHDYGDYVQWDHFEVKSKNLC